MSSLLRKAYIVQTSAAPICVRISLVQTGCRASVFHRIIFPSATLLSVEERARIEPLITYDACAVCSHMLLVKKHSSSSSSSSSLVVPFLFLLVFLFFVFCFVFFAFCSFRLLRFIYTPSFCFAFFPFLFTVFHFIFANIAIAIIYTLDYVVCWADDQSYIPALSHVDRLLVPWFWSGGEQMVSEMYHCQRIDSIIYSTSPSLRC